MPELWNTKDSPVITVQEVEAWSAADQVDFFHLVNKRQEFKLAEEDAKKAREECDKKIATMLELAGPTRVQSGEWVVQRVTSSSGGKIEPTKLVELGVSPMVIRQATTQGKPYSYVMVKGVK